MKKITLILASLLCIGMLSGCSKSDVKEEIKDLSKASWEEIVTESKRETVNIHMWGGNSSVNRYMDEWVSPILKEKFDINLNRVPINEPKDVINKLLTEKQVDKTKGSVDILWINGENFKMAKDNSLVWGPFVDKLPNFNEYIDKNASDIKYDFGEDIEGMEAPWGRSQFVFIYNSEKIKNPPKTMGELKNWIKQNPGKFTYPAPPDFTGSAFVRQVLINTTGGYEQYSEEIDKEKFNAKCEVVWEYLNEIKPYLWRNGNTYPESSAKLDQLYSSEEVWMTMSYNPSHASNMINAGQFSSSSRSFVLQDGTLSNTHYLSIPFNASNKAGAMVVINLLLSPEAQIAKFDPAWWGDGMVISNDKLSKENKEKLNSIDIGEAVLSPKELEEHRVIEIPSKYIDEIEKGWMENVAKK